MTVFHSSAVNYTKAVETLAARILKSGLYPEKINVRSGFSSHFSTFCEICDVDIFHDVFTNVATNVAT